MTRRTPPGVGSTMRRSCECRRCVTASNTKREVVRPVMTVMGTPCAAMACPSRSNGPMCAVAMITPWPRARASRSTARFSADSGTSAISSAGDRWRSPQQLAEVAGRHAKDAARHGLQFRPRRLRAHHLAEVGDDVGPVDRRRPDPEIPGAVGQPVAQPIRHPRDDAGDDLGEADGQLVAPLARALAAKAVAGAAQQSPHGGFERQDRRRAFVALGRSPWQGACSCRDYRSGSHARRRGLRRRSGGTASRRRSPAARGSASGRSPARRSPSRTRYTTSQVVDTRQPRPRRFGLHVPDPAGQEDERRRLDVTIQPAHEAPRRQPARERRAHHGLLAEGRHPLHVRHGAQRIDDPARAR